jgi:uncharacterized protein YbaP (TraB family)
MFSSSLRLSALVWSFLFVSLVAVAALPAPQKAQKPAAAVQRATGGKHCLWRVTDAKAPVYLLGSIHSMRKNDYPLPPVIEQAIRESQEFYFEIDPRGDAELGKKLGAAAVLPKGVVIKQKIDPKVWNFLVQISTRQNYSWAGLRAWAIALFVLDYPVYERTSSAYGLDNYVEKKARAHGRPMHGLETVDQHVNVYAGMTDLESEVYLLEAIVFAHQSDARYREAVNDWRTGNIERLYQLEMPDIKGAEGLNPRFLEWRNVRWIPKIESAIKSGRPTIIVAGAMHFSGPHSVIGMLRARGHTIEQL